MSESLHPCAVCDQPVSADMAELSYIRFARRLCRNHYDVEMKHPGLNDRLIRKTTHHRQDEDREIHQRWRAQAQVEDKAVVNAMIANALIAVHARLGEILDRLP